MLLYDDGHDKWSPLSLCRPLGRLPYNPQLEFDNLALSLKVYGIVVEMDYLQGTQ
jgi:hypothetical protein